MVGVDWGLTGSDWVREWGGKVELQSEYDEYKCGNDVNHGFRVLATRYKDNNFIDFQKVNPGKILEIELI